MSEPDAADFEDLLESDPYHVELVDLQRDLENFADTCLNDQRVSNRVTRRVVEARIAISRAKLTREQELFEVFDDVSDC